MNHTLPPQAPPDRGGLDFAMPLAQLEGLDAMGLDRLACGVIGFQRDGRIDRYNAVESRNSGLQPSEVLGHALFKEVAQCMDNRLVAQRYADASAQGQPLDLTIDYVVTFRMRPTPVRLRLLSSPQLDRQYLLVRCI